MTAHSSAHISADGRYRYELIRRWDDDPMLEWIMLNPSTADAAVDDPTIKRCIGFAKAWGYGAIVVHNLYALRATDPAALGMADDPFGPLNRSYLGNRIGHCTIAAWGANPAARRWFLDGHRINRPAVYALGFTADGSPRHPLYVRADATPVRFWAAAA